MLLVSCGQEPEKRKISLKSLSVKKLNAAGNLFCAATSNHRELSCVIDNLSTQATKRRTTLISQSATKTPTLAPTPEPKCPVGKYDPLRNATRIESDLKQRALEWYRKGMYLQGLARIEWYGNPDAKLYSRILQQRKALALGKCVTCPAGKWQSKLSKHKCYACPKGMFQPLTPRQLSFFFHILDVVQRRLKLHAKTSFLQIIRDRTNSELEIKWP